MGEQKKYNFSGNNNNNANAANKYGGDDESFWNLNFNDNKSPM